MMLPYIAFAKSWSPWLEKAKERNLKNTQNNLCNRDAVFFSSPGFGNRINFSDYCDGIQVTLGVEVGVFISSLASFIRI